MLQQLQIKNYALIEELLFSPSAQFNTITGETGAGKSIMLGALGLLLGNRAETRVLSNAAEKCVVEGIFDISNYKLNQFFSDHDLEYEKLCIIRREILPSGKSRAFINDTPATLDQLKQIGGSLIDIHSQHENLLLNKEEFLFKNIDSFCGTSELQDSYSTQYSSFKKIQKEILDLKAEKENALKELDFKQFQLQELKTLQLVEGETSSLEKKLDLIENIELIKTNLHNVSTILENTDFSVLNAMQEALALLKPLQQLDKEYKSLFTRLEQSFEELKDIQKEADSLNENLDHNAEEAIEVKNRFNAIQQLLQKHRVQNDAELIKIQEELESHFFGFEELDLKIISCEKESELLKQQLSVLADELASKRKNQIPALQNHLIELIKELEIKEGQIEFRNSTSTELSTYGFDHYEFYFSANKGLDLKPIQQVASGGEFSRLMFAIKYLLAEKIEMPTLLFDEIDTGISGEIALKMGNRMKIMAQKHQIIVITHLPQIAAYGNEHYFVYKQHGEIRTTSNIKKLNAAEREIEIAKMIGGENYSESALTSAKELLNKNLN